MTVRTATKQLLCFIRDITPSPFLHHTTPSAIRSTAEQAAGVGEATGMTATLPQLSNPRARAGRDHHQGPIPGPPVLAVDQSFVAVKHHGNHSYLSDFRDFARRRTQSNDILDKVGRVRMQPETLCQPRPDYGICAAAFAELENTDLVEKLAYNRGSVKVSTTQAQEYDALFTWAHKAWCISHYYTAAQRDILPWLLV